MVRTESLDVPLKLGSEAHLIPKGHPETGGVRGKITGLGPIQFESESVDLSRFAPEQEMLLIFEEFGRLWRMQAKVRSIIHLSEHWKCELDATKVWEIDQRRSPRYSVDLPVEIGFVAEVEGEPTFQVVNGTAINMSLTGARVKTDAIIPPGTLFHLTFRTAPVVIIKSLAITSSSQQEDSYVGLSFIEFIEDGQLSFHEFLGGLAA